MSITLAGVPLLVPNAAEVERIADRLDPASVVPWLGSSWAGSDLRTLGVAQPPGVWPPTMIATNTYAHSLWAGRWGYGAFVASEAQASLVLTAAHGPDRDGSDYVPLKLDSPGSTAGETATFRVEVLRAVPLTAVAGSEDTPSNNAVLLIVVDAGWRRQRVACPDFGITPTGAVTWRNCFDLVAGALGGNVTVDAIDGAYLQPDESLNLGGEPAGVVLDALGLNVGMRTVVGYDGSIAIQRPATARSARQADDRSSPLRVLIGGGDEFGDEGDGEGSQ